MSIDPATSEITYLSDSLPRGFFMGAAVGQSDFLICNDGSGAISVGLDGPARWQIWRAHGVNNSWRGCFLSDIEIRVEQGSYFTQYQREPRPGDVVIHDGKVSIAGVHPQLGNPYFLVEWGPALASTAGQLMGGFAEWTIVQKQRFADVLIRTP